MRARRSTSSVGRLAYFVQRATNLSFPRCVLRLLLSEAQRRAHVDRDRRYRRSRSAHLARAPAARPFAPPSSGSTRAPFLTPNAKLIKIAELRRAIPDLERRLGYQPFHMPSPYAAKLTSLRNLPCSEARSAQPRRREH